MSQWEDIPLEDDNKWEDIQPEQQDTRSTGQVVADAFNPLNWPKNALAGLSEAGKFVDEYTGAPVRKFITEAVTGQDLEQAPSGAEQAKMLMNKFNMNDPSMKGAFGLPEKYGGNIKASDVYGVSLEMLQDPLMLIGEGAKFLDKGADALGFGKKAQVAGEAAQDQSVLFRNTDDMSQVQKASQNIDQSAKAGVDFKSGGLNFEQKITPFEIKQPKSLEELKGVALPKNAGELTGVKRLQEIENIVPDLETKPLNYHYQMFENPKAMKELKLQFENLPSEDAKNIAAYNQQMLRESEGKLKSTIDQFSKTAPKSLSDSGYDLIERVKGKYGAEKSELGPLFNQMQKNSYKLNKQASRDMIVGIGENTNVGKLLDVDQDTGRFLLKKNTPRSGMSDQEHGILSRVIDDLNDGMTFKELQDTRDFLRKNIDPANPGATAELSKVRSILLDQMQNLSKNMGDQVHGVFKRYAINERNRENIEKIIGGKIESLDSMFAANPDKAVKKIFANPNYVEVVREYLGDDAVNDMISSYLKSGYDKAVDSAKGFQPHVFKSWLRQNEGFIKNYVPQDVGERINALADYGYYSKRFLDEVNPSGTAASLAEAFKPGTIYQKFADQGIMGTVRSETVGRIGQEIKQRQAKKSINEILSGVKPEVRQSLMKRIQNDPKFDAMKNLLPDLNNVEKPRRSIPMIKEIDKQMDNREKQDFNDEMSQENVIERVKGSPYEQVLKNASQSGNQSFAAANYVLQNRDEKYRKMIKGER